MNKIKFIILLTIILLSGLLKVTSQEIYLNELNYRADQGNGTYVNPIIKGNYPDPTIMRDGKNFYMTHSSYTDVPGLLVWHSLDLVNWTPVSHALTDYIGNVWAPDLLKYGELYYIYFPASGSNYVVTAEDPSGPWSQPIDLKIDGIDPGHIVTPEGKRYLHLSDGFMVPLSDDGLKVDGEKVKVYDGWKYPDDWIVECFCLESPKLFYKNGWYYLTSAQGGTAGPPTSHMVVSARSKTPFGPWENSPYNPIIRNVRRDHKWASQGHGSMIDTPDGDWWIVFHGYDIKNRTIGRQNLLLPIEWTDDGWFRVPHEIQVDLPIKKMKNEQSTDHGFQISDNFGGSNLKDQWVSINNDDRSRFTINDNALQISCDGIFPEESDPLLVMPQSDFYEIQAEISVSKNAEGGILLYYNANYYAGISLDNGKVFLHSSGGEKIPFAEGFENKLWLKLINDNHDLLYLWSNDGVKWERIDFVKELSGFHHNALSDWSALRPGVFGSGTGIVEVKNWKYKGLN